MLFLLLSACNEDASILVVVTSELAVPVDLDRLRFQVEGESTGTMVERTFDITTPFPHSLSVRAAASDDQLVVVEVTGELSGALDPFVVRRVGRIAFSPGENRRLELDLPRECVGVMCPGGADCVRGRCVGGTPDGGLDGALPDGGAPDGGLCGTEPQTACSTAMELGVPGGRRAVTLAPSSVEGSCGGAGAEAVVSFTTTVVSDVFISTHASTIDTVVYVRACGCEGMELGCNDDADGLTSSALQLVAVPPGTYNVFVDTKAETGGTVDVDVYVSETGEMSDRCGHPAPIAAGATTVGGDTCTFRNDYAPMGCGMTGIEGPGAAQDRVFYFTVSAMSDVTVSGCNPMNTMDTTLYLRRDCEGMAAVDEVVCNDDMCPGAMACGESYSSSIMSSLEPGLYYLFVDGYDQPDWPCPCGTFSLDLTGI